MSSETDVTIRTRRRDAIDPVDETFASEALAQPVFDRYKEHAEEFDILTMIRGNPSAVDIQD